MISSSASMSLDGLGFSIAASEGGQAAYGKRRLHDFF